MDLIGIEFTAFVPSSQSDIIFKLKIDVEKRFWGFYCFALTNLHSNCNPRDPIFILFWASCLENLSR